MTAPKRSKDECGKKCAQKKRLEKVTGNIEASVFIQRTNTVDPTKKNAANKITL